MLQTFPFQSKREEAPKEDILDNIPSEESTKVYNYVNSNGKDVVKKDRVNSRSAAGETYTRITRSMARGNKNVLQDDVVMNDLPSRRKSHIM